MPVVSERDAGLALFQLPDERCILVQRRSGLTSSLLPSRCSLHWDEASAKFYVGLVDEPVRWASQCFDSRLWSRAEDARLFVRHPDNSVTWLDDMQKDFTSRTFSFSDGTKELSVLLHRFSATRSGGLLFWQVRDIQAMLTLQLTGRTSSRWISNQWDSWTSLLNEYTGIDIDAHCLRNHNSQAARQAAGHAAATGAQQTMLEFSVSTFCLLGLLSRWAGTLKRQGGSEASRVLRHLLASVLPAAAVMVPVRAFGEDFDISSSWPACSTSGVAGHIRLQGGLVFVPAHIIAAVPDLRSGLARIVL